MTDDTGRQPTAGEHGPSREAEGFDRELRIGGIVATAAGILVVTAVAMVVIWYVAVAIKGGLAAADPELTAVARAERARRQAASPAPAAAEPSAFPQLQLPAGTALPPGPRLQPSPETEMAQMRAEEERELTTYAWVDRERGMVRVPIDRAIADLAARGLPEFAPPESATESALALQAVLYGGSDEGADAPEAADDAAGGGATP